LRVRQRIRDVRIYTVSELQNVDSKISCQGLGDRDVMDPGALSTAYRDSDSGKRKRGQAESRKAKFMEQKNECAHRIDERRKRNKKS
jgi:hypothetical protein